MVRISTCSTVFDSVTRLTVSENELTAAVVAVLVTPHFRVANCACPGSALQYVPFSLHSMKRFKNVADCTHVGAFGGTKQNLVQ